ncbi:hypothetical protein SATG_01683 [Staphylococcus aureus subsp. aureus D139]|nr:hypothetical protein SATG_01683 [Staphylococcus aureus subsp. aureus D139]
MRSPNIENFEKKFYRQCELGLGPIQKLMESQHTIIAGPQHRGFRKEILQTMRVGGARPQHREIGFPISTDNGSWRGPNTENFKKKFYRQCKLGLDDEINFAKISFQSHSQEPLHNKSLVILYYFSPTPSS